MPKGRIEIIASIIQTTTAPKRVAFATSCIFLARNAKIHAASIPVKSQTVTSIVLFTCLNISPNPNSKWIFDLNCARWNPTKNTTITAIKVRIFIALIKIFTKAASLIPRLIRK